MISQKALEICPDLFHFSDSIFKAHDDAERARLPLEDYLKGDVDMHIHYVFRVLDNQPREFCAILKWHERKGDNAINHNLSIFDCFSAYSCAVSNRNSGEQKLMFVDDVKVMQETEDVSTPSHSIIKRLQFLNSCECSLSNPILQIRLSSIEGAKVFQNGKVHRGLVPPDAGRVLFGNKSKEKVIKGSSGVVEGVADNQRPLNEVGLLQNSKEEPEFTGLSIKLLFDGIGLTFAGEGGYGGLESVKVAFCSLNLCNEPVRKFGYLLPHWFEED